MPMYLYNLISTIRSTEWAGVSLTWCVCPDVCVSHWPSFQPKKWGWTWLGSISQWLAALWIKIRNYLKTQLQTIFKLCGVAFISQLIWNMWLQQEKRRFFFQWLQTRKFKYVRLLCHTYLKPLTKMAERPKKICVCHCIQKGPFIFSKWY